MVENHHFPRDFLYQKTYSHSKLSQKVLYHNFKMMKNQGFGDESMWMKGWCSAGEPHP